MRGRFSRRHRRNEGNGEAPIEPRWLERVAALPMLEGAAVEPDQPDDVPDSLALVGRVRGEGPERVVAVSPHSGGDAVLAVLVAVARSEGEPPLPLAVAPHWDAASRRRLAAVVGIDPAIVARILPEDAGGAPVSAEPSAELRWAAPASIVAQGETRQTRGVLARASAALEGLAAKHGGALRIAGAGGALELVLQAQTVASLRGEGARVLLEVHEPSRQLLPLTAEGLPDALDRLEGSIRKRLNDRRIRESEAGFRGGLLGALEASLGLRFARRWPFAGLGGAIDLVGVTEEGAPIVAAVRQRLGLRALGEVLDAALLAEPWLPALFEPAGAPLRSERPRLVAVAERFDGAAQAVLGHLALGVSCYETGGASGALRLLSELDASVVPAPARPQEADRPARPRRAGRPDAPAASEEPSAGAQEEVAAEAEAEAGPGRGRRRRSRGRRRRGGERAAVEAAGEESSAEAAGGPRIDEVSLFDLDDEPAEEGDAAARRRRRGGRGRRGRGGRKAGEEGVRASESGRDVEDAGDDADIAPSQEDFEVDEDELGLSPDVSELDERAEEVAYDDEEPEPLSELDRQRIEREKRRRARHAALAPPTLHHEEGGVEEHTELPRGRVALLAHADRESIAAAVLLARDKRQVEGIWVYPQEDLMTFFRGVATDLRENTPIYVIGFLAKPARDAVQAAALYRGRLVWFDHHDWPPEDLGALSEAIGADLVRVVPGAGSSLALVVPECTRRSRFSEKLVDLVTGRFTHHDFQRWGRLWWWRLGDIASRPGERRSELEMLLAGRPSDLTKEAARAPEPPLPRELAYVSERDFRLVHFAGLGMVVAELPAELDLHLTMRIARERYGAVLSLVRHEGDDLFVLGADDVTGRRAIDLTGMLDHLAEKFGWVVPASDGDHIARFRVRDLATKPDRLDELIAEIGMGRSVLEG